MKGLVSTVHNPATRGPRIAAELVAVGFAAVVDLRLAAFGPSLLWLRCFRRTNAAARIGHLVVWGCCRIILSTTVQSCARIEPPCKRGVRARSGGGGSCILPRLAGSSTFSSSAPQVVLASSNAVLVGPLILHPCKAGTAHAKLR